MGCGNSISVQDPKKEQDSPIKLPVALRDDNTDDTR